LLDAPALEPAESRMNNELAPSCVRRSDSSMSLGVLVGILVSRRWIVVSIVGGLLLACLLYCLIEPNQYEAKARVALRIAPAGAITLDGTETAPSGSFASGQTQLETLASVLRSDQLAWKVIREKALYRAPAFMGRFARRFPEFRPDHSSADAEGYLLERFQKRLHVVTLPRTLVIEIRFRSGNPALSADVVSALIQDYTQEEAESRRQASAETESWMQTQLDELKARAGRDDRRLARFQKQHGILISSETLANGKPGSTEHLSAFLEVDELGRELAAADSERILREAEYRAAAKSDPEAVLALDPHAESDGSNLTSVLRQLHARHSDLEQEQAQLSIERGPNFPRVVEIRQQLQDLDRQLDTEDASLRESFRSAWQASVDHEQLVRKSLHEHIGEGMKVNEAATEYQTLRREADSTHDLYIQMQDKVEEAGLAAGVHGSDIWVVDEARPPAKPVAPDPPVYMAITLFAGMWIAAWAALMLESLHPSVTRVGMVVLCVLLGGLSGIAQAPTPSTSGLPTGVARIPVSRETKDVPSAKDAPPVWNGQGAISTSMAPLTASLLASPMAAPIVPGDLLDISEFHTPEFHSAVRVSGAGTVKLPMIGEVSVDGMEETEAANAIAAALVARGLLNHPEVFVLITAYVGQDVSVLGEVARPGMYPFTLHHRLFDLISAASGLSPFAGGRVNIYHRTDPNTPHTVVLDSSLTRPGTDRNPELAPGDTVEVSRAGLVYVVGDVIRPGGFTVDPTQEFTVLKALSLAWGTSQNAAVRKAILIREQKGGRTVTTLNLKRMLRGQDPDLPIEDHDILFVPDSTVKNLWNRTVESAIQSAAGVSIYAGMVYSQRF
jgi:polysaccharide export outer membrane protein